MESDGLMGVFLLGGDGNVLELDRTDVHTTL